ncbi:MAG TPA: molybdopterin cofactor-binding domain-containing protein, partial [Chloroflexota bacterium]|nr:molybdopterin cofactor-binding domain-containing protein [Chloroflexota bacterium]
VSYGALVGGSQFNHVVPDKVQTESSNRYTVVGKSVPRVDLPGKLTGPWPYVQNLRVPGMVHGRVIHPAGIGATLESVDESTLQGLPGLVKVVRNGNFLGVIAEREEQAIALAQKLNVTWKLTSNLPKPEELASYLKNQTTEDKTLLAIGNATAAIDGTEQSLTASYFWPYQAHASIGPSCAVADVKADSATVWSSTQGVFPLQGALAQLLGMPADKVRVIHQEGAGCYGHNGFDDAAADAALLSKAAGKPVRVQWMRADEFVWEPKGPPMLIELRGGLDQHGTVVGWDYGVWTPTHSTRPGGQAGNLLAGQLIQPPAPPATNGFGGGDRNAQTNYNFKNNHVVVHWVKDSPLRPSALRSLGGAANSFANESFMDELAAAANVDPIEFRLRHLSNLRAIAVIKEAAKLAKWQSRPSPAPKNSSGVATGRGISFMQYENHLTYVAVVAEVQVDQSTGQTKLQRISVAHDCGLIINPDGLRNQIEGNCIQAASRALKEQVTFSPSTVTSVDWESYPILTFPEIPDVQISLIDHPDQPAWGVGEATTENIAPAIANAIFDATGARVRSIPMTPAQVKAAIGG